MVELLVLPAVLGLLVGGYAAINWWRAGRSRRQGGGWIDGWIWGRGADYPRQPRHGRLELPQLTWHYQGLRRRRPVELAGSRVLRVRDERSMEVNGDVGVMVRDPGGIPVELIVWQSEAAALLAALQAPAPPAGPVRPHRGLLELISLPAAGLFLLLSGLAVLLGAKTPAVVQSNADSYCAVVWPDPWGGGRRTGNVDCEQDRPGDVRTVFAYRWGLPADVVDPGTRTGLIISGTLLLAAPAAIAPAVRRRRRRSGRPRYRAGPRDAGRHRDPAADPTEPDPTEPGELATIVPATVDYDTLAAVIAARSEQEDWTTRDLPGRRLPRASQLGLSWWQVSALRRNAVRGLSGLLGTLLAGEELARSGGWLAWFTVPVGAFAVVRVGLIRRRWREIAGIWRLRLSPGTPHRYVYLPTTGGEPGLVLFGAGSGPVGLVAVAVDLLADLPIAGEVYVHGSVQPDQSLLLTTETLLIWTAGRVEPPDPEVIADAANGGLPPADG